MANSTVILKEEKIDQKIKRMAYQIYEKFADESEIVVVGIREKGALLAEKIADELRSFAEPKITLESLKLKKGELKAEPEISFSKKDLDGKVVALVDDVLNSGITLIHAASHLLDANIKELTTIVLVDRRHRKFPIRADIVGMTLSTTLQEHIEVDLEAKTVILR